jgi:transposase
LDNYPISSKSLGKHYHFNGDQFGQQYKDHLSDYLQWDQKEHAEDWLPFPDNLGPLLSLDETSLLNGELYTILTNKAARGKKGVLVAVIKETEAETVIEVLTQIPKRSRDKVEEITLDMAGSMNLIVKHCFVLATRVIDRSHAQKLAPDC